jgi:hypothetical protein
MRNSLWATVAASGLMLSLAGGVAQANMITVDLNAIGGTPLASVTAEGGATFLGYTGVGQTSSTDAVSQLIQNATPTNDTTALDAEALVNFTAADDTQLAGLGSCQLNVVCGSVTVTGQYFSLKIDGPGGGTAFFENTSGGPLVLDYTQLRTQAGLSGVDEWGTLSAVPGPIVGAGLPGLIAAVGGLLALARRRQKVA